MHEQNTLTISKIVGITFLMLKICFFFWGTWGCHSGLITSNNVIQNLMAIFMRLRKVNAAPIRFCVLLETFEEPTLQIFFVAKFTIDNFAQHCSGNFRKELLQPINWRPEQEFLIVHIRLFIIKNDASLWFVYKFLSVAVLFHSEFLWNYELYTWREHESCRKF